MFRGSSNTTIHEVDFIDIAVATECLQATNDQCTFAPVSVLQNVTAFRNVPNSNILMRLFLRGYRGEGPGFAFVRDHQISKRNTERPHRNATTWRGYEMQEIV
jgi:hypothetical protein